MLACSIIHFELINSTLEIITMNQALKIIIPTQAVDLMSRPDIT